MKFFILCLLGIIPLAWSYADVSDKVHFEDIIKKPDVLRAELYCYLDRGPCDEVAAQHKIHITEAVNTACAKCTPSHKHNVKVFIQGLSHLFLELYHEFRERYDPDGKHYDRGHKMADRGPHPDRRPIVCGPSIFEDELR